MTNMYNWLGVACLQLVNIPLFIEKISTGKGFTLYAVSLTILGISLLFWDCVKHREYPFIVHLGLGILFNLILLGKIIL